MVAAKKEWFLRFLYWTESLKPSFKAGGLTNDYKLTEYHKYTFQPKFCSPFCY